jgi:hypothetical protein
MFERQSTWPIITVDSGRHLTTSVPAVAGDLEMGILRRTTAFHTHWSPSGFTIVYNLSMPAYLTRCAACPFVVALTY